KGVATLVTRTIIIAECRRLERRQMVEENFEGERGVAATEEVLINPSFPDQRVTIGGGLSEACRDQLKHLLKDNMGVFAWEPSDMTGVPRRIVEHILNVNPSMDPNVRATYQRLVDSTFQCQIGRNLKACMDDMVIKSKDGKMLLADIAETFDNLKKINMKLNPKKCSFGVEEGKLLWYIVTSKGIIVNPKNTKALANLQSPRTLKEMQSLSGKLAALNQAVSAVLLNDKKGRQCPVQYVSRTLNEAEMNYAPMKKLALSLIHMTRRLRRYFKPHSVKVITDQQIKNILNNTKTSRKLAKYAVESGAYYITYIPCTVVKGQVLADFLSDAPEGEKKELHFQMPEVPVEKDDIESWTLFTDEASSLKGLGAGLVLVGPSGIEYTYALRLTFLSTNNEAEYEALLAGLRIARQMNILNIEVKVDYKLVASQINKNYKASKDSMIKYMAKAKEVGSTTLDSKVIVILKRFKATMRETLLKVATQQLSSGNSSALTVAKCSSSRIFIASSGNALEHFIPNMNQKAYVLSKLVSVAFNHLAKEVLVEVLKERSTKSQEVNAIVEEEGDNWMTAIIRCLKRGIWPTNKNEAWCLRANIGQCEMESGVLFKKGYLVPMLSAKTAEDPHDVHRGPVAILSMGHGHLRTASPGKGVPSLDCLGSSSLTMAHSCEAIFPAEIGMPTYRTLLIREGYIEKDIRLNLNLQQENKEAA
nr:hypothetical protein [Tanacetum cinerariifolium]